MIGVAAGVSVASLVLAQLISHHGAVAVLFVVFLMATFTLLAGAVFTSEQWVQGVWASRESWSRTAQAITRRMLFAVRDGLAHIGQLRVPRSPESGAAQRRRSTGSVRLGFGARVETHSSSSGSRSNKTNRPRRSRARATEPARRVASPARRGTATDVHAGGVSRHPGRARAGDGGGEGAQRDASEAVPTSRGNRDPRHKPSTPPRRRAPSRTIRRPTRTRSGGPSPPTADGPHRGAEEGGALRSSAQWASCPTGAARLPPSNRSPRPGDRRAYPRRGSRCSETSLGARSWSSALPQSSPLASRPRPGPAPVTSPAR